MDNYIVYDDETGNDGINTSSSDSFILTAVYMCAVKPQEHFKRIQNSRKHMREKYTRV